MDESGYPDKCLHVSRVPQNEAMIQISCVTTDQKFTRPQTLLVVYPFRKTTIGTRQVAKDENDCALFTVSEVQTVTILGGQ